jgi:hypothetical protein
MRRSADLPPCAVLGCSATDDRGSETPDLAVHAKAVLDAYAKGDKSAVMALIDPNIRLYGSDVAEIFSGRQGAHFGDLRAISEFRSDDLATLFFDVPFSDASRPEIIVRFATLWRYGDGAWRLIQIANTLPAADQSAEA